MITLFEESLLSSVDGNVFRSLKHIFYALSLYCVAVSTLPLGPWLCVRVMLHRGDLPDAIPAGNKQPGAAPDHPGDEAVDEAAKGNAEEETE